MAFFDINTEAAIKFTAKLGAMHKSALPLAVRGTLNNAAFETKKEIPKQASKKFTTRSKTLFKAFSSVNKAKGFNINKMSSQVGIRSDKSPKLAKSLGVHEKGGSIIGRKLIPHDKGRISGSFEKKLRKANTFQKIGDLHDSTSAYKYHKGTKKSKFTSAVISASKNQSKYFLLKKKKNKKKAIGTVFKVKSLYTNVRTKKIKMRFEPVFSYRTTKRSGVKSNAYMLPSSMIARKKMNADYVKEAERQIKRLLG